MVLEFFWIVLLCCTVSIGADTSDYTVNITTTDSTPTRGNSTVDLKCTYTGEALSVTIDRMRRADGSWKALARFSISRNTSQLEGSGLDLKARAELSMANGSVSLNLYSTQCNDTAKYKCQIMPSTDERLAIYSTTSIDVLDEVGEPCGAPWHTISVLHLGILLLAKSLLM
ncbi:uncharacterized protein [Haliotis cracherodii]|uniref:uncharacterized protein n=1 Tax=Haliotis cracherodii TaxID=6455 RepID=UPI0039E920E0